MSDTPRTDAFFDLLRRYEYAASQIDQEEQKLIDLCRTLERSLATREAELRERDARIAAMEKALRAVANLIENSRGVVGLHLNGDEAPWDELLKGGRFEDWLIDFSAALAPEQPHE